MCPVLNFPFNLSIWWPFLEGCFLGNDQLWGKPEVGMHRPHKPLVVCLYVRGDERSETCIIPAKDGMAVRSELIGNSLSTTRDSLGRE